MDRPCNRTAAVTRSIAGSVAPIADVAGINARNVPTNATSHCHAGAGCAPVNASSASVSGGMRGMSPRLHAAITSSQAMYQRAGRALRSIDGPARKAPSARPAKNAATTANTAADSWPSHKAACCVHTI